MQQHYLNPTEQAGINLFSRNISGQVVMLNLLKLNPFADYSTSPELAPDTQISGRAAFTNYIEHTTPFLEASGGELMMLGDTHEFFIGPADEPWDLVMLVKQSSLQSFLAFASNAEYLKGIGHRTAAVKDSRLLPIYNLV